MVVKLRYTFLMKKVGKKKRFLDFPTSELVAVPAFGSAF